MSNEQVYTPRGTVGERTPRRNREAEYPGYWYFYARSPVSHYDDTDPNGIYRFQGPDKLPGNPNDAGWQW